MGHNARSSGGAVHNSVLPNISVLAVAVRVLIPAGNCEVSLVRKYAERQGFFR